MRSSLYASWRPSAFFALVAALSAASSVFLWRLTPLLQRAALAERSQLGFELGFAVSPQASPAMPRAQDPSNAVLVTIAHSPYCEAARWARGRRPHA